ncbi:GOLPH3/VPS74 family protein [Streptomyces cadmiisoli]|uniref:GOLPH3/VPS74 family protein n=1 Tax=Streptomyces cadmiisoli TaxID=2184053 RepID=UPI0036636230
MTTARHLMIIAMEDEAPDRPVDRGDLSLALAGAELIDLLAARTVTLDDERVVPGDPPSTSDSLLEQAASSLVREAPHESVDAWLWRRGRDLSSTYVAAFKAEGQLTRQSRRGLSFRSGPAVLTDSADHRAAASRWASAEPTLVALATAVGIPGPGGDDGEDSRSTGDDTVDTVVAAVHEALTELDAIRQRRAIEQAAFDNIWRGE